eukprot:TRINITY_DN11872_c0_g2_i1.p1 TRINITY_DN11872_c0_g2~~TRINITY_DN11872_c0_g2_i1.p1  ORF type:complete len:765 (+),score=138.63 TRINITY_DN11872_c0_g2_i1:67-2361(+)
MVKRALCVGCNYPSKAFGLAGGVNDAFLMAEHLEQHMGFEPDNVVVLHDVYPGQKKSVQVDELKRPTRVNILTRLHELVRSARAGDVIFFSFSGYGLQVDDMETMPEEGLDEAILPTDYQDGRGTDYSVIVCSELHDVLAGIPQNSSVTVVMDCDHATSIADVSGTLDGQVVSGLKEHAYCGVKGHTAKVQPSEHRREVWQEERARQVRARPRFQPALEIANPRKGPLPTRTAMSRSSPVAFCFSAAGHGQTAMELQVKLEQQTSSGKEERKQHGVLSWCFLAALKELKYSCTYLELHRAIQRHVAVIKRDDVPRLDQEVLLTFSTPLSNPASMRVLQPVHEARSSSRPPTPNGSFAPPVVPPPPAGYLTGGSASCPTAQWMGSSADVPAAGMGSNGTFPPSRSFGSHSGDGRPSSRPPSPPRKLPMAEVIDVPPSMRATFPWHPPKMPGQPPPMSGRSGSPLVPRATSRERAPSRDSDSGGVQVQELRPPSPTRRNGGPSLEVPVPRANSGLGDTPFSPASSASPSLQATQFQQITGSAMESLSALTRWFSYQPPSCLQKQARPRVLTSQNVNMSTPRNLSLQQVQRPPQPQQQHLQTQQSQPQLQTQQSQPMLQPVQQPTQQSPETHFQQLQQPTKLEQPPQLPSAQSHQLQQPQQPQQQPQQLHPQQMHHLAPSNLQPPQMQGYAGQPIVRQQIPHTQVPQQVMWRQPVNPAMYSQQQPGQPPSSAPCMQRSVQPQVVQHTLRPFSGSFVRPTQSYRGPNV